MRVHLLPIEDQPVPLAFAIDPLTLSDHLNCRDRMMQTGQPNPQRQPRKKADAATAKADRDLRR
jgi:hypothetical protein